MQTEKAKGTLMGPTWTFYTLPHLNFHNEPILFPVFLDEEIKAMKG